MTKEFSKIAPILVFILTAIGIAAMIYFPIPWNEKKESETYSTRLIIPQSPASEQSEGNIWARSSAGEETFGVKIPLKENEMVVAVLTDDFDGDLIEEQFVAYRNLLEIESPIYLSYIANDGSGQYREIWREPSPAAMPGTVSLKTQDIIGDRSLCVLVSGMNDAGEHTLTVFRKNTGINAEGWIFTKIAELHSDGPVSIRQADRSQAYHLGLADGESFQISAYGRDLSSSNIMDQLEFIYAYDESTGLYTENSVTKVPGIQIEQRRVRELLGNKPAFEEFITGLWFYTSPQGTINNRQYVYFDPLNREIIFYGDDTQQVYIWQNSTATRYGLYITSQNISITNIRRSVDITLESMENIYIKVSEDIRMNFGISAQWDGSYRKSNLLHNREARSPDNMYLNAVYDSAIGRISFLGNGSFEILYGNGKRNGNYVFFHAGNNEILELRFAESGSNGVRETYLVTSESNEENLALRKTLTLEKIRLGAGSIESLQEGTIILNIVE